MFVQNKSVIYADYFDIEIYNELSKTDIVYSNDILYSSLVNKLNQHFNRVEMIDGPGEMVIKGDSILVWLFGYNNPIRLTFFGEDIESISLVDSISLLPLQKLSRLIFLPQSLHYTHEHIHIGDSHGEINMFLFTQRILEKDEKQKVENYIETDLSIPSLYFGKLGILEQDIVSFTNSGYEIVIQSKSKKIPESIEKYIKENKLQFTISNKMIKISTHEHIQLNLPAGFISKRLKIVVFTDRELFSSISVVNKSFENISKKNVSRLLQQFEGSIEIGNFVVHEMYGIGKYKGLQQEEVNGLNQDYLLLEYAMGDELYVPLHQIDKITKYIGPEDHEPELTRLGTVKWANVKKKVKASTKQLAKELLEHFAKRELSHASSSKEINTQSYQAFVKTFPYTETPDQQKAISEVLVDLTKKVPMNRLLIGDVGFGKTEVIIRAAFKIAEYQKSTNSAGGGQVAILAPTTVLVAQHFKVLSKRLTGFGIRVDFVSRFKSTYENKDVLEKVKNGEVDIVIGTHRLLSSDVDFKNLQLLVVDEEQRFGVKQKEKIKKLNYGVHVLSVSATPIPRTLSMALSSIQDISVITTPPQGRKSIKTQIIKDDWSKATDAIQLEIERGGQVYFVHNEVRTIYNIKEKLELLAPNIKVVVGHGQMDPQELDTIMYDFYNKKYDVLLSTTIIENGLDLENVNTIIINKAHRLGLSQLYQLRGRVGRSERQAYCYLMYPSASSGQTQQSVEEKFASHEDKINHMLAKKKAKPKKYLERMQSLVDNQDLGAGYRIASKDLEIRGAGNILGNKQHGHISSIGYTLYIQMLAQEVERLKALGVGF